MFNADGWYIIEEAGEFWVCDEKNHMQEVFGSEQEAWNYIDWVREGGGR